MNEKQKHCTEILENKENSFVQKDVIGSLRKSQVRQWIEQNKPYATSFVTENQSKQLQAAILGVCFYMSSRTTLPTAPELAQGNSLFRRGEDSEIAQLVTVMEQEGLSDVVLKGTSYSIMQLKALREALMVRS